MSVVAALLATACTVSSDDSDDAESDSAGQAAATTRFTAVALWLAALLRHAQRQHRDLLGRQHPWAGGRAGGNFHCGRCRRAPFLRFARRRHRDLLGAATPAGRRTRRRELSLRSLPAGHIRAACAATAASRAGGWSNLGQAEAPTGAFTAVAAGEHHSCGLRSDSTVTCWGSNDHGQSEARTGAFTAVTAGGRHSCGLRSDSTVTCWGQATPTGSLRTRQAPSLRSLLVAGIRAGCAATGG